MKSVLGVVAVMVLVLGLGACCTESDMASGKCCSMGSGSCKTGQKPMACDMKPGCSCCPKGAADGPAPQGHQH